MIRILSSQLIKALKILPILPLLLLGLNQAYAHPGHGSRVELINSKIEQSPNQWSLYQQRGLLLLEQQHFEEAEQDFNQVEKLAGLSEAAFGYAKLDQLKHQCAAAINGFQFYLETHTEHEASLLGLAECHEKMNHHHQAARYFDKLCHLFSNPDYCFSGSKLYQQGEKKNYQQAINLLDFAMTQLGPLPHFQSMAIDIFYQWEKWDEALSRVEAAEKQYGPNINLKLKKAKLMLRTDQQSNARQILESLIHQLDNMDQNNPRTETIKKEAEVLLKELPTEVVKSK